MLGHICVINIFKRTSESFLPRIVVWISHPITWVNTQHFYEINSNSALTLNLPFNPQKSNSVPNVIMGETNESLTFVHPACI